MKLTWCLQKRPTWSVRRWSSLSMRRDSLGTRIPPKMRKRTTKTNTGPGKGWGEEEENVVLNSVVLVRRDLVGAGREAKTSKTSLDSFVFWCCTILLVLLLCGYNLNIYMLQVCATKPSSNETTTTQCSFSASVPVTLRLISFPVCVSFVPLSVHVYSELLWGLLFRPRWHFYCY